MEKRFHGPSWEGESGEVIQRDEKKTIWAAGYFPLPQILLLLHQTKLTPCIEFQKNLNGSIM